MSIKTIAQRVAQETWGFVPGRQVKPVHMANGLFRELTQEVESPTLLRRVAGGFRSGTSRETTAQIRELIRDRVIDADGGPIAPERIERLRAALDLVFHQDRALFATGSYYSPTLTHRALTTPDPSHSGTGRLLAQVLIAGAPRAVKTLRDLLDSEADNLSLLASPLVDYRDLSPVASQDPKVAERVAVSNALSSLQEAFNNISLYHDYIEKTVLLQRMVTLGSFGLILHLLQPINDPDNAKGERVPQFLCSDSPSRTHREASRATFRAAARAVLLAFESNLRNEYITSGQEDLEDEEYLALAEQGLFNPDDTGERQSLEQFRWNYRAERTGDVAPFDSFVRSLAPLAFQYVGSSSPMDFFTYLGRLAGIVYPRLGGAGDKYFRPAPQFLDMLVSSVIQPKEEIVLDDFWERLWIRYGIICGGRRDHDAGILHEWGVPSLSAADLDTNADNLSSELYRMGYVHRFADGVALISSGIK